MKISAPPAAILTHVMSVSATYSDDFPPLNAARGGVITIGVAREGSTALLRWRLIVMVLS